MSNDRLSPGEEALEGAAVKGTPGSPGAERVCVLEN